MAGHGGPDLVQDGLVLSLDAASKNSYPGSGTTWTDLSGDNNGTLSAEAIGTTEAGVMTFVNGGGNSINIGNNISTLTTGTLEAWFTRTSAESSYQMIFSDASSQLEFTYPGTGQTLTFYLNNSGVSATLGGDNEWYHVVGTFDTGGNFQKIYVNNVLENSTTYPGDATAATSYIGGRGAGFELSGKIPIIRVYNRYLTTTEISQNFNAQRSRFGV